MVRLRGLDAPYLYSLSIPAFWKAPPLVIPTTMLIGGVLWTLALQLIERGKLTLAVAILPTIPFLTVFLIRLIFRKTGDPDEPAAKSDRPSTVRALLMRSRGFGPRSTPVKIEVEVGCVEPSKTHHRGMA